MQACMAYRPVTEETEKNTSDNKHKGISSLE